MAPRPGTPHAATGPAPRPWRRIAVDEAGPAFEARPPAGPDFFDFPDTECDGWSTADLTMRYASVRGARHRYHSQPRQDSARAAVDAASGTIVFAVADGVSRATLAHRGALVACEVAVNRMLDGLYRDPGWADLAGLAAQCTARLGKLTRWWLRRPQPSLGEIADLYATTLVAGIIRPAAGGPVAELCRIGDSGAWVLDRANGRYYDLFGAADQADVVSTSVTPLPYQPEHMERVGLQLRPSQVLLAGTDGFGLPLGDGDGRIGELFARELGSPPPPAWLAHVLDFSRATFDDDRTLLAIWPRNSAR
ncbi:protein phosphatase 2C domain-containing protein [Nocardia sp. NPDC020380]|uniref:protein phosphatase 2C domain-containing protein n=1 Tax=Nocardia sp. NPDC020380 TaxID=3364309 RepID=UPI003792C639